jgi:hypothetical protein
VKQNWIRIRLIDDEKVFNAGKTPGPLDLAYHGQVESRVSGKALAKPGPIDPQDDGAVNCGRKRCREPYHDIVTHADNGLQNFM